MLPAALLYLAIITGSITETPFVAYDLAVHMSKAERIEWTKMTDDQNNVKFTITFYKMPVLAELGFERTIVEKHKNCRTKLK